jgi:hypothetical protein
LRKFLEANGARISTPRERNFETEGEAIESGLKRTIAGRDAVMRSLIRAVYRFRDATLVAEKKDDFGNALQNLYRELERAEDLASWTLLIVPSSFRSFRLKNLRDSFFRAADHDFVQAMGGQID